MHVLPVGSTMGALISVNFTNLVPYPARRKSPTDFHLYQTAAKRAEVSSDDCNVENKNKVNLNCD